MLTVNINFIIDAENAFALAGLPVSEGGSLYVPEGEKIGEPIANFVRHSENDIFILGQDFHPPGHKSFASSHPGAEPFSTIYLKKNEKGLYVPAAKETTGTMPQTLWLDHGIQNTRSALFVDEVMNILPPSLAEQIRNHAPDNILGGQDEESGNIFYVVRKGTRLDLDSYGIATENDGITTTAAPRLFSLIAHNLQQAGIRRVNITIGGLATNYCVEMSHKDIYKFLIPALQENKIESEVFFLTDISRGIPVSTPDGSWPDLKAASARMQAMGTKESTTMDIIRNRMVRRGLDATTLKFQR